jgi:hypothetical protein
MLSSSSKQCQPLPAAVCDDLRGDAVVFLLAASAPATAVGESAEKRMAEMPAASNL